MKKTILILLCSLSLGTLYAQSNVTFNYSIGFPSGDLSDFTKQVSFRGATFDFRKMVNPNIGVGFSLGWNVFYEELASDTYTVDNVSLSGKQYRYSNHIPMMINPTYYLKRGETINPYVSLGIGTMYTRRNTDMNLYTVEQEAWNFLLQPEIGMQYMLSDMNAINLSGKFNYGFKAGNELTAAQSFFTLNIGFTFLSH
ncbi:MAG: outer membrane beta-barrel protein [Flammeovirgaceae bacterium]|nr:outer membrane beta-barrel protein [Flammeovirgaceae bacterium]